MARLCERPGCSAAASVAYGFEAVRTIVWLEPISPENADSARAGALCRRHADSLTPPRGWWLDDRRVTLPRLFSVPDDADFSTPVGPAGRPPEPATVEVTTAESATVDESAPRPTHRKRIRADDHTAELPFTPEAESEAVSEHALPTNETTAPHDQVDPAPTAASGPPSGADETAAVPWTATFNATDDLGGVLNAHSPLLSRAFGVVRANKG